MQVVDTSAWVESLLGSALGKRVGQAFPAREDCIVPTLVQLELSRWLNRERLEDEADQVIAYAQKCIVVALDTRIALPAAEFSRQYTKLATADAIVYATAHACRRAF